MRSWEPALCAIILISAAGCAHVKPSTDAVAKERYETYGPKFTDEQKESMSVEEKLAIYNNEVREKDRLVCRAEQVTGSHIRKTRCFTREEIITANQAARLALTKAKSRPLGPAN